MHPDLWCLIASVLSLGQKRAHKIFMVIAIVIAFGQWMQQQGL